MTVIPLQPIEEDDYMVIWRETRATSKSVKDRIREIVHAYAIGTPAQARNIPTTPLLSWVEVIDEPA